jgi:uncharacterized protein (TIGR02271 family)
VTQPVLVSGKDGWHGIVHSWPGGKDRLPEDAREVTIRLDNGEKLNVPGSLLLSQPDGTYYVPLSAQEIRGTVSFSTGGEPIIIPVIHEELEISKRTVETGAGVRIRKIPHEEEQTVDLALIDEQVEVERIAVDRAVDSPVPVRHVGDTIIVPVLREVLVVEKQLRLVEELHIRKKRTERHQPQTVTLRKEEAIVERLGEDSGESRGE